MLSAQHWYLQVKWRARELTWSDIGEAVERFDALRREHTEGRRVGTATFAIVSNAEPDAALQKRMSEAAWATDILVVSPRATQTMLPSPAATLDGMIDATAARAATVPFSRMTPRTLVLKLAAHVQLAATGVHEIEARHLPALLEQVVTETQSFPTSSDDYFPNDDVFTLDPSRSVQWLLGPSGVGKTTWAAENVPLVAAEVA